MDPFSANLHPDSAAGPSRSARPVSVQPTSSSTPPSASRKRASHSVVPAHQQEEQPVYRDVYSHPAAIEYAAAHPRRTIPKFGPYLLLRTLGEGEFGKVKLGLHMQWGEEVAVKLIRRGNIDSTVRMSKIEREIEVLRTLKHPNIVRLYDVIETDKYIGIILEYASGGELFDHILAHRYLREKDACKLFCQLISGVWYIHQKKIVHRDLKLENLLLDRNRNVIITDFGFANRFEHRSDDLMQTSCGSPCYAAPELVISDGLYVGSAVDIWSCGVILYAMLAGYLPFDDDPANPDGDNINLLYKYIVNTPLSFPDYISEDARDLLSIMLVPDPVRRADLPSIMTHRWLAPYAHIFNKSVDDLERSAMEQHHQKRLAYQRSMKQAAADSSASKISRSQSAATASGSRGHRAQPEYLYETSADMSVYSASPASARRGVNSAIVVPTSSPMVVDDDPFAPSGPNASSAAAQPTSGHAGSGAAEKKENATPTLAPVKSSPDTKRKGAFRHTIQVEYGTPGEEETQQPKAPSADTSPTIPSPSRRSSSVRDRPSAHARKPVPSMEQVNQVAAKPLPIAPVSSQKENAAPKIPEQKGEPAEPVLSIEVTSPPVTPASPATEPPSRNGTTSSAGSSGSTRGRHKRGISMDKIGISKLFSPSSSDIHKPQTNGTISRTTSQKSGGDRMPSQDTITGKEKDVHRRPSTLQVSPSPVPASSTNDTSLLSPDTVSSTKKSRRNTLTVMVEPFRTSLKQRTKGRTVTPESASQEKTLTEKEKPVEPQTPQPPAVPKKDAAPTTPNFSPRVDIGAVPASTLKANKVMQWFRSKSKGRAPSDMSEDAEKTPVDTRSGVSANGLPPSSTSTVSQNSPSEKGRSPFVGPFTAHPTRAASNAEPPNERSFASALGSRFGGSSAAVARGTIRVHQGAVDQSTITTAPPPDVMKQVKKVLEDMGLEIQIEGDYKYRCIRPKRKKAVSGINGRDVSSGLAALTIVGSAASNGVDKRGLPVPSPSHSSSGGGMLRGLLMRRQSSQVSTVTEPHIAPEAALAGVAPTTDAPAQITGEPIYGNQSSDQGDEVRFSVELTRIDRLDGTYSLDIRRLKGNLRSYKFLYDTLRQRADLQR
ncbi:Pkinase-domain-containing protein [Phanerochaete sordida]|uniref:non-specific serine/threonine protein kinase n=1 Tax=Phanerochaete sordida TaxID=48140 RepID=A0A9P3G4P1_9APHY|nr:Pkinase-domain-containing protein [Phanerochaete sordida]